MQLLISAMETQTTQTDGACELTPECNLQIMKGSGLASQQTSRLRAATLARLFDCMDGVDLNAHINKLCIQVYKVTKSLEAWDHLAGTRAVFIQQKNRMLRVFVRHMCAAPQGKRPPISVYGIEGRYVTALYSAASQTGQLDEVDKHLKSLEKELSNPKMIDFLETSVVSRIQKAKIFQEVAKQVGMPDTAANFLGLVAENGRLKKLKRMISMFLAVMIAHHNRALCEVITAEPLDDSSRKSLMDALQKFVKGDKKIELTEKVDPSIIGGMVVGVEDKHIDMSIVRKIQMYTDILKQSV